MGEKVVKGTKRNGEIKKQKEEDKQRRDWTEPMRRKRSLQSRIILEKQGKKS